MTHFFIIYTPDQTYTFSHGVPAFTNQISKTGKANTKFPVDLRPKMLKIAEMVFCIYLCQQVNVFFPSFISLLWFVRFLLDFKEKNKNLASGVVQCRYNGNTCNVS